MPVKLTIPLDDQLLDDLKAIARTEDRKKAPMGRVLLREAIELRKARMGLNLEPVVATEAVAESKVA